MPLADLAGPRAGDRITFADAQVQPRTVITSPEWSGIEAHGRRYAPFTINVERAKPWHTLSRPAALLPRPRLDARVRRGPARLPAAALLRAHLRRPGRQRLGARPELALRYLTPHSKWSIHSEYQDNLHMLTLFRGGPVLWLNHEDAERARHPRQRLDRGCTTATAWSPAEPRSRTGCPKGTCMMYHAKDRHLNVPLTELRGKRGGTDNSLTRITMKPTHLIGGYAQLSFGFNYYGPTGSQRDEITIVAQAPAGGRVLMRIKAQIGDGHEPRQVHRLPHLLGHLQAGVDEPARHRVRLVQQRRDQAGPRLPASATRIRSNGRAAGRSTASGRLQAEGRRTAEEAR